MESVTDGYVAMMNKPENQNGFFWRMCARREFPEGVNPKDERVIRLSEKALTDLLEKGGKNCHG